MSLLQRLQTLFRPPALTRAREHLQRKEFSQAIAQLQHIAPKDADHPAAQTLLIEALISNDQAALALQQIASLPPELAQQTGITLQHARALEACGQTPQAEACLREALARNAQQGQIHMALARLLARTGRPKDALAQTQRALKLIPELDDACIALAQYELHEKHQALEALQRLTALIERQPTHLHAHLLAAEACLSLSRFDPARSHLQAALQQDPYDPQALMGMGRLHMLCRASEPADACFRSLLAIAPDHHDAAVSLITLKLNLDELEQARDLLEIYASEHPHSDDMARLQGRLALLQGDVSRAGQCFQRALQLKPDEPINQESLGNYYAAAGEHAKALDVFRKAWAKAPARHMTRYNLALQCLGAGLFREGFEHYEARLALAYDPEAPRELRLSHLPMLDRLREVKRWKPGQPLRQRHILVWREQGFGDAIMMMRFLRDIKALAPARITLVISEELLSLARLNQLADNILSAAEFDQRTRESVAGYDLHCPIMSLPHACATKPERYAQHVPYLTTGQPLTPAPHTTLRIGLTWAGSQTLAADKARSIPFDHFAALINTPGTTWVSLQKGPRASEADSAHMDQRIAQCHDFLDTAKLIDTLDLIICVDTAVAHLAGAMGKPVWLLNRFGSEWRWGHDQAHSIWYPSMRLFNQQKDQAWSQVLEHLQQALQKTLAEPRTP